MTTRRRLGLVATAWFGLAITVTPVIAAVTNQGGRGLPMGGPAAPLAISLEPGANTLISTNSSRTSSDEAAISRDGRWVTYRTTLAVTSATRADSVLLADRAAGTTTRLFPTSLAPVVGTLEVPALSGAVEEPSVSADGSLVAFGLTSGTQAPTIVLWRRGAGLSLPLSGTLTGNVPGLAYLQYSALHHPRLSADGSVLAFQSDGYLDANLPLPAGFYVLILATGQVEAVSAPTGSTVPGPYGRQYGSLAISDDGSVVAFASSQNLLATAGAGLTYVRGFLTAMQIWRRDRSTLTTTLVSAADGLPVTATSDHPALSSDGSVVAFESAASNLVAE